MGSGGGPGLGRNPSKGENFRGLQGKPRQSLCLLAPDTRAGGPTSPSAWVNSCEVKRPSGQPLPQRVPVVDGKRRLKPAKRLGQGSLGVDGRARARTGLLP